MEAGEHELIIIGAGLSGIVAAQRYLDVHPDANIAILEKDSDIGGVFSKRRGHDGFWTQWTVGLSEFVDMPMRTPLQTDCHHDFYKAKYTTQYLEDYVSRLDHAGRTIRDRVVFNIDVQSIKKIEAQWRVECVDLKGDLQTFFTQRLMIASGLTSVQNMPKLPGKEHFGGPIIHSEQFGERGSEIIGSEDVKRITVVGGGKSSADIIYAAVKCGKDVTWLIRNSGTGAPFFASGRGRGPYKNAFEAGHTRMAASMNPSILNDVNGWNTFLHRTGVGTALLKRALASVDNDIRKEANYKGRKSSKGFEKLEYGAPFFWQNGTGGLLHHDDFWDIIATNVQICRDEILSLEKGKIQLEGGGEIQCDAILCGTGWKPSLQFFEEQDLLRLDLPHLPESESSAMTEKWAQLMLDTDKKLCSMYPMLENPPPHPHTHIATTPYRLYQGMVSAQDDSILFMNHIVTGNKLFAADIQAMWAVAFFDKRIALPSVDDMDKDTALWVTYSRRRYLSSGELGNNLAFETITYTDRLLKQLGLTAHKKGMWKDMFEPFRPSDLGKAWQEYLGKLKSDK